MANGYSYNEKDFEGIGSRYLKFIVLSFWFSFFKTFKVRYNFASQVAKMGKNILDERIQFAVVKIDGALAMVWASYQFYYKGKFSHCGTDSFQLARVNGKWKIQYLIDTRRSRGRQ